MLHNNTKVLGYDLEFSVSVPVGSQLLGESDIGLMHTLDFPVGLLELVIPPPDILGHLLFELEYPAVDCIPLPLQVHTLLGQRLRLCPILLGITEHTPEPLDLHRQQDNLFVLIAHILDLGLAVFGLEEALSLSD